MSKNLLIVSHAPSDNTRALTEAVARGARDPEIDGVDVKVVAPLQSGVDDVLWASAIILGTTANFGYMSGALKDFFDRIYYPCLEQTERLPYALWVRADNDPTGAQNSVERIVSGLSWRQVQPVVLCVGPLTAEHTEACEELGMALAAGLEAGIY